MNLQKEDKLDMLIRLAISDCNKEELENFRNQDTSDVVFSRRYYRRRRQVINRFVYRRELAMLKRVTSKVAMVALIVMSAAFVTIMSISSLRTAVFNAIVEWYEEYISIRLEPTTDETESEPTRSIDPNILAQPAMLSDEVLPSTIRDFRKPTYAPKGGEERILAQNSNMNVIDYYVGDELQYSFRQRVIDDSDKSFDNIGIKLCAVEINGYEAVVLENTNKTELSIVWEDSEYFYYIVSYLDLEKTVLIAKSVG